MDYSAYLPYAFLVAYMFGGSINAKFLAPTLVASLGTVGAILAGSPDAASFIFIFYIPALLIAGFGRS